MCVGREDGKEEVFWCRACGNWLCSRNGCDCARLEDMELWKRLNPQCPLLEHLPRAQTFPRWVPVKQWIYDKKREFKTTRFWADLMNHNRNKKAAINRMQTCLQDISNDNGVTYGTNTTIELAEMFHDLSSSLVDQTQRGSFEAWQYGTGGPASG